MPHASNLKEKRKTLRSVRDRLRNKNFSVIEADYQDLWQRASLEFAIAAVSHSSAEERREELRRMLLGYDGELTIIGWREEFVKL